MNLHNLSPPKGTKHAKKRIGRGQGSGNGKTAGRGHKGAKSRSGFKFKRGFEGGQMPLHRRVPEARVPQPVPRRVRGRQPRHARRAVRRRHDGRRRSCCASAAWSGPARRRQGAGRGEIAKELTVRAHKFSGKAAREKIAAAGGTLPRSS